MPNMVRTMRKARKEGKERKSTTPTPGRKDSARLSILRRSSGFTPVNAKSAGEKDGGDRAEGEELPNVSEVLEKKGVESEVVGEGGPETERGDAEEGSGDNEDEPKADSEKDGEENVDNGEDHQGDDDFEESEGGNETQELDQAEDEVEVSEEDEDEDGENEESHESSDFEDTNSAKPNQNSSKPLSMKGKRTVLEWEEPEDTERLLDLVEQFAMRDYYINPKRGGWRNNALGKIAEEMGKDHKQCSNRYFRLKYKYVEVLKLLGSGVGLSWDDESNEVCGSDEAWEKVRDRTLVKLKGHKFLYKEEFDNLNGVLNFLPSPKTKAADKATGQARKTGSVPRREDRDATVAAEASQSAEDENDEVVEVTEDIDDEGNDEGNDGNEDDGANEFGPAKLTKSLPNTASGSATKSSSKNKRPSDRKWWDLASIHKLVQLLVEYVQDDYFISPMARTWKNGVFREIAAKIGKDQKLCQQRYTTLKDTYMDIEKLLKSDLGFKWDTEKCEVIGSSEAWAQVKDTSLVRRRRCQFPFREEFAKLAEKLNFETREYPPRKSLERTRFSGRTSSSRPSYVEPPDEVDQFVDGEGHGETNIPDQACKPPGKKRLFSETFENRQPVEEDAHVESDTTEENDEPPRKKRLLSDTYEKRREAFYIAATSFSAKRGELKAMVEAQLAIQREQVAIHKEQIAVLHAQFTVENKLSKSLEECHLKDSRRRDDLENWRATAKERLQNETCLTPQGKLTMIQTLRDCQSKAEGYLGVMFLDPCLRRLWLKAELEKLAFGDLSDYFDEADVGYANDESSIGEVVDEDSGFSLVDGSFEFGEDDTLSAKGACQHHDSSVGIHFRDDGCSSDPREEDHISNDEEPEEQQPVENTEQTDEADPFEIDPYISVEGMQDGDVAGGAEEKPEEEEADGASMPVVQEVEDGYADAFNDGSLDDDTLVQDWLNEDAFALSNEDGEFEDAVEHEVSTET